MSGSLIPRYPPVAAQWADPKVEISGWRVLGADEQPMPGDVVAEKINWSDASGHVGIVVEKAGGGVETMSVTAAKPGGIETIMRTNFGFRGSGNEMGAPVFRRYVGSSRSA